MKKAITPTNVEVSFSDEDIIVSKTDLKGRITYVNQTFCHIAGYTEAELLGQPHSIIRHPDMPRAVFKLLWDTIIDGREIFAYVKNMSRNGDYYWVLAHVTPSYDAARNIIGYHSNRRVPDRDIVRKTIVPIYDATLQEEGKHRNGQQALAAGFDFLVNFVKSRNTTYDALVFSLSARA
jgi:PAS domain S-box-containing protein